MHQNLDVFQYATAMARHAGARQALVAKNVANADTPGYRAMAIKPFSEVAGTGDGLGLRRTRGAHLGAQNGALIPPRAQPALADVSPNGNSVVIEDQMLEAINISREHDRALVIYRHAMTVLKTGLGRS